VTTRKPARRRDTLSDPASTEAPSRRTVKRGSTVPPATEAPISGDQLDAVILRTLRRLPNRTVDLTPLAEELAVEPADLQLGLERLGRRRLVVLPFVEPSLAGGATLTEKGLRWLIEREGGKPADVPVAFKPAKHRVRAADEAARLPRAEVYGLKR
jgi:hypothetical protein